MRSSMKAILLMVAGPLLLAGTAFAEDLAVTITNDGTEDILVTVYDRSSSPSRTVLTNTRISSFTSVPISVAGDANGKANLSWTATSTDRESPKCGHADTVVSNSGSITVHADSTCSV